VRVVVLAAGEASRLYPYSDVVPKPMLYVGGKPVLRRIIERLRAHGFTDVLLCVNSKHEAVFRDYFEDGGRFNVSIEYSVSPHPHGTAGELLLAYQRGLLEEEFLLHYADELTRVDYGKLVDFHRAKGRPMATLALVRGVPLEVGVAKLDGNKVVEFVEKPVTHHTVWSGIAVLRTSLVKLYCKHFEDLASKVFPQVIANGGVVLGFVSETDYLDMGTISHYRRACEMAEKGLL